VIVVLQFGGIPNSLYKNTNAEQIKNTNKRTTT